MNVGGGWGIPTMGDGRCRGLGRHEEDDDTINWLLVGSHTNNAYGGADTRRPSTTDRHGRLCLPRRSRAQEKTNLNCEKVFPFYIVLNFYESKKFRFHFIIRFGCARIIGGCGGGKRGEEKRSSTRRFWDTIADFTQKDGTPSIAKPHRMWPEVTSPVTPKDVK